MANLKEIKLKIGSVKNTQKTTKAMKLVSSAKLTRTRQLSEQARSYAVKINEVLSDIAARVSKAHEGGNISRAFVKNDNPKTVDIVFVTADKGLCGGFNMATIKTVSKMITEYKSQGINVRLRAAGKKGVEYFTFQKFSLEQRISDLSSAPDYDRAADFIDAVVQDFRNEVTDKVVIVYNGFLNMLTQEMRVRELLPIGLENVEVRNTESALEIEPDDDEEILDELANKYIDFNMYYALIDSLAAEHSARMQAMEAATKNAKEKVNSLTVEYNKARQAAITTELIEIISGVEALK
jgi:F-type H+-transporting ATPase subunit gamma